MTTPTTLTTTPHPTTPPLQPHELGEALRAATHKLERNLPWLGHTFPDDATVQGQYRPRPPQQGEPEGANVGWTTGFCTGMLWLTYEHLADDRYRTVADTHVLSFRDRLDRAVDIDHHDLGFLYSLSCVAAHRLTGSTVARQTALDAADLLLRRYFPAAGIIQAWGDLHDPAQRGRIIVDCLMNLPLLYWATEQTGDDRYRAAAYQHALRSRDVLVRPDHTTFHTFHFDVQTGVPLTGSTHQGAHDHSCWARGQAWSIYGFALSYAATRDPRFLKTACELAGYFLSHLPADHVAYWDLSFDASSGEPRDSSAAAIAACGLLELARWLPDGSDRNQAVSTAHSIVASLVRHYATTDHDASNALLLHGVYHRPHGIGVDEANLWGDYFYLEALTRLTRDWTPYW
ncbi:glycoside hydrolase family 88 protein [Deinococcus knuensis]|uniref:Glycosyl hydrolase n=1 Tax=Deinococcus knuensis TaxID=1837380 RepID=A0ABQ2SEF5_9DEIO|nr:glycoside hydrolase family 88 protein [Deinococcus knuensis]GGS25337.1 glycosyl hydrolase [Deinococcus knuensis]